MRFTLLLALAGLGTAAPTVYKRISLPRETPTLVNHVDVPHVTADVLEQLLPIGETLVDSKTIGLDTADVARTLSPRSYKSHLTQSIQTPTAKPESSQAVQTPSRVESIISEIEDFFDDIFDSGGQDEQRSSQATETALPVSKKNIFDNIRDLLDDIFDGSHEAPEFADPDLSSDSELSDHSDSDDSDTDATETSTTDSVRSDAPTSTPSPQPKKARTLQPRSKRTAAKKPSKKADDSLDADLDEFESIPFYSRIAQEEDLPHAYELVFENQNATAIHQPIETHILEMYDAHRCAQHCNEHRACRSFGIFVERQVSCTDCVDAEVIDVNMCRLYNTLLDGNVITEGRVERHVMGEKFTRAVRASNGYNRRSRHGHGHGSDRTVTWTVTVHEPPATVTEYSTNTVTTTAAAVTEYSTSTVTTTVDHTVTSSHSSTVTVTAPGPTKTVAPPYDGSSSDDEGSSSDEEGNKAGAWW